MNERPSLFGRLLRWAVFLLPYACVTAGAWWISPPAGLIALGGLLWLDLQLPAPGGRRRR